VNGWLVNVLCFACLFVKPPATDGSGRMDFAWKKFKQPKSARSILQSEPAESSLQSLA